MDERTREPQYQCTLDLRAQQGLTRLGLMTNVTWDTDPKRLAFVLSRYKFVAKMLSGLARVLEVGCADAWGSRIVVQEVGRLTAVDFDPIFIEDARSRMDNRWGFDLAVHDILQGPVPGAFDGAYSLDVLEHIPREREDEFVSHLAGSLGPAGVLIVGSPSLSSQAHASEPSRLGHINCKEAPGLKTLLARFFRNVFLFSMNDEVVHTGFYPLAHYYLALCCGRPPGSVSSGGTT